MLDNITQMAEMIAVEPESTHQPVGGVIASQNPFRTAWVVWM